MNKIENNNLKKNFNDWAILSIINNVKNNNRPAMGWKILAGKKVTVEVVFRVIRKFKNEMVVKAVSSHGKKTLMDMAAGAQKLNFYLPDDLVLFQTEVKHIDVNGDITVGIPEMMAQVDRRKNLRLFVENSMNVNVEFMKQNHGHKVFTQKFEKKCFDVSSGGFSFLISKAESRFFMSNDSIFAIELTIGDQKIELNGTVTSILELEPNEYNKLNYKAWKVCVKYSDIEIDSKKKIDEFVFRYVDVNEAI